MAKNLDVLISLQGRATRAIDLSELIAEIPFTELKRLLDGTAAGQIDQIFMDTRTLSASANENLDVASGGGLLQVTQEALALARLKLLIVRAAVGNTNNVNVTQPGANGVPFMLAAGDGIAVRPGECKVLVNQSDLTGIVVTAGTGDLINFANSGAGTPVTYDVIIAGASA